MVKSRVLYLSSILSLCLPGVLTAADTGPARQDVLGMDSVKMMDTPSGEIVKDKGDNATPATGDELAIKKYQEAIFETERTSGAYGDKLWEQLVGLGVAQQNAGLHHEAVESFNHALHINRVNLGLHNLRQEPIINLLIKSNTALADWKALDQNYEYLYWLYRRVYGENDMHLLTVIDRAGLWHLNAYNMGASDNPFAHLLAAQNLYSDAVHIIETNAGKNAPDIIAPLYGIMLTNYLMAVHAGRSDDTELRSGISMSNQSYSRCSDLSFFHRNPYFDNCNGAMDMTDDEANRQELVNMSYRAGKKALTRMIEVYESNPAASAVDHAMAYIHLGDWYVLFNRPSTAASNYAKAFALLENTDSATREKLLGVPRQLPELQITETGNNGPEPGEKYVVISMDISETGRVRNVQVVESQPPDDKMLISQARRNLRYIRFRPRIENGEPVSTTGYKKLYVFK